MTTSQFINEIVKEMRVHLTKEQLALLTNVMADRLQNVEFKDIDTQLQPFENTNEYYLEAFLACKSVEGCSERTLEQYAFKIRQFYTTTGVNLLHVNTNHIRAYLYKMTKQYNWAAATQEGTRCSLGSFYQWLQNEEYIDKNPCSKISKIKTDDSNGRILSADDIELIREHCVDDRERAMVELMISTGMRCNEIRILKVQDINFDRRTLTIHGKGGKIRTGYLNAKAFFAIKKMLDEKKLESPYVFSKTRNDKKLDKPLCNSAIEGIIKRVGKRAGMGRIVIHNFRHYFASELCRRNMNLLYIQELMGHNSVETTKKIYINIQNESIQHEYNKYSM